MRVTNFIQPVILSLFLCPAFGAAEDVVRVQPKTTEELFANPGMGWQTFHHFADDDKNLQGLPSGSAYFRFYWREVEPEDGAIDFPKFDQLLARSRRAGQKLAFRIMTTGSGQYMDVPKWLRDQGCKGTEFTFEGRNHWVPDFEDPLFQKTHLRLINELGKRYDGHPDLDLLDIGSVGLWGEWHMSGTKAVDTGKQVPLPSLETRMAFIDAWCRAFPKTGKVILIGSEEGMARAAAQRYGWRADCLGDMGGFSKNWNHMEDFYMQQLEKTGAQSVWQVAPVAYESCWDMRKWSEAGWDIDFIFDYALRTHASYMNNKSTPIPDGTRPQIERFLQKLGYRLVVKMLEHPPSARPGSRLNVVIDWENIGVAPPYRDYTVALRLSNPTAKSQATILASGTSIRGWLPGQKQIRLAPLLPDSLTPADYDLAVGVVDPATNAAAVRLAIEGRDSDGWYPLSRLNIIR